jgi:hypothetical protein
MEKGSQEIKKKYFRDRIVPVLAWTFAKPTSKIFSIDSYIATWWRQRTCWAVGWSGVEEKQKIIKGNWTEKDYPGRVSQCAGWDWRAENHSLKTVHCSYYSFLSLRDVLTRSLTYVHLQFWGRVNNSSLLIQQQLSGRHQYSTDMVEC